MDTPARGKASEKRLIERLAFARQQTGPRFLPDCYEKELVHLHNIAAACRIEADLNHPLWWFIPAILFDIHGSHDTVERLFGPSPSAQGLVMIPPPFVQLEAELTKELVSFGLTVKPTVRPFSRVFVGLIYGGYPWFEAYVRLNAEMGTFTQPCVCLLVKSSSKDVASWLLRFKERRRDCSGKEIRRDYPDLAYPGLLRPFHTPARIENSRHIRAVALA